MDALATTAEPSTSSSGHVWRYFATAWAIAVLFHLAGNSWASPAWGKALVGASAVAVIVAPRSRRAAVALSAAVLVNVWLEAPMLGNHFLLHGFVALIVLGAAWTSRSGAEDIEAAAVIPLRLLLLAFYAFAAFAKLNSDFFDPAVSCGPQFFRELTDSWGLDSLPEGGSAERRAVALATAGIEMSIPVMLVAARTRRLGVVVALGFHLVLALNRDHQFFDFSAILVALFVLFLPPKTVDRLNGLLRGAREALGLRWRSGPELVRAGALSFAGLIAAGATFSNRLDLRWVLHDLGVMGWIVYGSATFALVLLAVCRSSTDPQPLIVAGSPLLLFAVPLLAVANGLTPYLELKTSASWNMYSNLAVVDGESNHLLVRRGLPVTDAHERLVRVVHTEGVDLSFYVGSDWRLPELMLEDHLADRPGAVVVGVVDGEAVRYEGGRGGARPEWQQKLQVFRAVDGEGGVGCQPSFGPAR